MAQLFAGTQIAADGKRYDLNDLPDIPVLPGRIAVVFGTPAPGDVLWQDPDAGHLGFASIDDVNAFVPTSS